MKAVEDSFRIAAHDLADLEVGGPLPDDERVERIDELVGRTPLVRLNDVVPAEAADVYVKMESVNPSGSIRDRYISEIVTGAVEAGHIMAGETLAIAGIDDSSVAAAWLTSLLGLGLRVFAPEHSSRRLVALIERFGADIEWTDEEAGLAGAIKTAARWAREDLERLYVDGYRRQAVEDAYTEIADEILEALHGRLLGAFVTSVTTGGTLRHVAEELRQTHPSLEVGGAILTDRDFSELNQHAYNRLRRIGLEEAWQMRDRIAQREGLLLSPKGAASVSLAIEMCREVPPDEVVVALNPDSGQRYLGWEDRPLFEVTFDPEGSH